MAQATREELISALRLAHKAAEINQDTIDRLFKEVERQKKLINFYERQLKELAGEKT